MTMQAFRQECGAHFEALYPGTPLVFGDGNAQQPALMLIGEAPGEQEVRARRPFVGKAGKNLDEFLQLMELPREAIYISNVVKLRPTAPGKGGRVRNRAPSRQEIEAFLPWLLREIDLVAPRALVTLGNVPLKALLGEEAVIGTAHGAWHTARNGLPLYALYHPAAIIYRRELKPVYEQDVRRLRDTLTFETAK